MHLFVFSKIISKKSKAFAKKTKFFSSERMFPMHRKKYVNFVCKIKPPTHTIIYVKC